MPIPPPLPPEKTPRPKRLTHPGGQVDRRVWDLEEAQSAIIESLQGIASTQGELVSALKTQSDEFREMRESLFGKTGRPQDGHIWTLQILDGRRRRSDKIIMSVAIAGCLGLGYWVVQLYAATHTPVEIRAAEKK